MVTTLVNLTNSYDTQEVIPEMIELAKFAKQHIPEEHELDDEDFVIKRHEVRRGGQRRVGGHVIVAGRGVELCTRTSER